MTKPLTFADIPADVTSISAETYRQIVGNATSANDLAPQSRPHSRPESDFRQQLADTAISLNWLVYWTWQSKHSPAGYPDMMLVRAGRLIFAELKSEVGTLSRSQCVWLDALRQVPVIEVFVWRPSDWDVIGKVLS